MPMDVVSLHRLARKMRGLGLPLLPGLVQKTTLLLHHSYIGVGADIGEGTVLENGGLGVCIDERARIGRGCRIAENVTIGCSADVPGAPIIGNGVEIGPGALILGNVRIGDGARIGPNALVVSDVPPGDVVVLEPAPRFFETAPPPPVEKGAAELPPPEALPQRERRGRATC